VAAQGEGRRAPDRRAVALAERGAPVSVRAETAYPVSVASARVRVAAFAPHLREHGVEVHYRPNLTDEEYGAISSDAGPLRKAGELARASGRMFVRRLGRSEDGLLLVHRLRFLMPVPGLEPARSPDAYDFDDALYLGSILASNRRFRLLKREAEHWLAYVRRARLVIAGNDHLATRAREHARRVEVVPSCVDPTAQPTREHGETEVVTIGWVGSRSTSADLREVLPVVDRLNQRGVRVRLVLIGPGPLEFSAPWLEQRHWSQASEAEELAGLDLGIMPLPDNEWTRGKCGYKLLQYFSAGVPAVASPVGINMRIIGEGRERGLLAATPEQWSSSLEDLIRDHEARAEMGAAARRFVEDEYSYQRWAPELAALLSEL
jgi:glycosyltransferase involved in cell wall biosynthesis